MFSTLEEQLRKRTRPAATELMEKDEKGRIRCLACAHQCLISEGKTGICKVRFNEKGLLRVPWGYTAGIACDPIEKKPFFHVFPGSQALSFGMLGCDFHCSYCQNWLTSQTLRDDTAGVGPQDASPEAIVELAIKHKASSISSTYNEPLITAEWAVSILQLAKGRGIPGSFVSNGNATAAVLDYIRPYVEFYKVDLKCFNEDNYRKLGGKLDSILRAIEMLVEKGFWVEVVTLVVPGFNDSEAELGAIASFLASVSVDIPWHVTGFHKDYHMTEPANTPIATLLKAAEIGRSAGLHFVYSGNRPGFVETNENTYCPDCNQLLIERYGFLVQQNHITLSSTCPACGRAIPGRWN